MRYPRFLVFEMVAALLWNVLYCLLGYFIGTQIELIQTFLERSGWVIFGLLIVLFFTWHFLKGHIQPKCRRSIAKHAKPGKYQEETSYLQTE